MRGTTNKVLLCISTFSAICFALLLAGLEMNASWITQLDNYFIEVIQGSITPSKTELFKIITFFGSVKMIGLVSFVVLLLILIKKKYRLLFFIASSIIIGVGIVPQVIKKIIQRPRPSHSLITETGFSFPSGHATSTTFLYSFLAMLICLYMIRHFRHKYIIFAFVFLLIIMVMISRVYLGVHYPSDVIAGFFLGLCESTLGIYLFNRKHRYK